MSTAILPPASASNESPHQRFVLRGVDWTQYRKFVDALGGRHVRVTYDRGVLELMTISPEHGNLRQLLGRIVTTLTEETSQPVKGFGDMTCDREDLDRGFEPDECYYIVNEPLVRGRITIDFAVDPPPDLGVEVDVTGDARSRLPLYASLRVPEVWLFRAGRMQFLRLGDDGRYHSAGTSAYFPFLTPSDVERFIAARLTMDENALIRSLREWVQTRLAEGTPA